MLKIQHKILTNTKCFLLCISKISVYSVLIIYILIKRNYILPQSFINYHLDLIIIIIII